MALAHVNGDGVIPPDSHWKPGGLHVRAITTAYMLSVAFDMVNKSGEGTIHISTKKAVDDHSAALCTKMDEFTRQRVVQFAYKAGNTALQQCEAPNESTRALAVCYAIMGMADTAQIDPETTQVVVALDCVLESDDDTKLTWKRAREPKKYAKKMLEILDREFRSF